jgi:IS30 family transposase
VSRYIDEHRGRFGVEPICRVLDVSASAYYQRATGARSPRAIEDERLLAKISALVECQTRFVMLARLEPTRYRARHRCAQTTHRAAAAELIRSLTWDQGQGDGRACQFSIGIGIEVFFCDPHSPRQRGSNENTNALLRQYLPKGTDLAAHSQADLDHIAAELNGRSRQTLDWATPLRR